MFARLEPDCEAVGPAYPYVTFNASDYTLNIFFLLSQIEFAEVNPVYLTFAKVGMDLALAMLIDVAML